MKLYKTQDVWADISCPKCGQSLSVESTYEDAGELLQGDATCPKCKVLLEVESEVAYSVKESI